MDSAKAIVPKSEKLTPAEVISIVEDVLIQKRNAMEITREQFYALQTTFSTYLDHFTAKNHPTPVRATLVQLRNRLNENADYKRVAANLIISLNRGLESYLSDEEGERETRLRMTMPATVEERVTPVIKDELGTRPTTEMPRQTAPFPATPRDTVELSQAAPRLTTILSPHAPIASPLFKKSSETPAEAPLSAPQQEKNRERILLIIGVAALAVAAAITSVNLAGSKKSQDSQPSSNSQTSDGGAK